MGECHASSRGAVLVCSDDFLDRVGARARLALGPTFGIAVAVAEHECVDHIPADH